MIMVMAADSSWHIQSGLTHSQCLSRARIWCAGSAKSAATELAAARWLGGEVTPMEHLLGLFLPK